MKTNMITGANMTTDTKTPTADPASAAMTEHQQMGTCAPLSARPNVRSWTHSHGCYPMYLESWAALLSNSVWSIKWNTATTEVTVGPSTFPVSLDCSSSEHLRTSVERAGYTFHEVGSRVAFALSSLLCACCRVTTSRRPPLSPFRRIGKLNARGLARRRRRCSIEDVNPEKFWWPASGSHGSTSSTMIQKKW